MKLSEIITIGILTGLGASCANLPNEPEDENPVTIGPLGRTYTNTKLGFQVTLPKPLDDSWGMSVQTAPRDGSLPDGSSLSIFLRAPEGRDGFRPTFSIGPFAVNETATVSDLGAAAMKDFSENLQDYQETDHREVQIGGKPAEQWSFRAQTGSRADRFFVTIVIHRGVAYSLRGDGIAGYYPVSAYSEILNTIKFQ